MLKFLSVAFLPCYKISVRDCTWGLHKIQSGRYKKIAAALWDVTPRGLIATEQTTEVTFHNTVFVVTSHVCLTKFITLLGFVKFITSQANIVETLSLPTQFLSSSKTGVLRLKEGLADTLGYRETSTSEWPAIRLSSSLKDLLPACRSPALDNRLTVRQKPGSLVGQPRLTVRFIHFCRFSFAHLWVLCFASSLFIY